jgi:hypothetical protein
MRSLEPDEEWMWCYTDQVLIYPDASRQYAESSTQKAVDSNPQSAIRNPQLDQPVEVQMAATKESLRPLPLFASLEEEDLDELTRLAEPRMVKSGGPTAICAE